MSKNEDCQRKASPVEIPPRYCILASSLKRNTTDNEMTCIHEVILMVLIN